VRVTPNASKDVIEGVSEGASGRHLKIRVRAAPEAGKANGALEALLAKALGVPKSAVSVEKGGASRSKTVRIAAGPDIAPGILKVLATLTGEPHAG
jgi:hypothetical protein